jgi:hypothetical protein
VAEQWLLEDGTPWLLEDGTFQYLETGDTGPVVILPPDPNLPPVPTWSLDLCRRWARIAEVDAFTFNAVEKFNAPGEWTLEVAPSSISDFSATGALDEAGQPAVYGPADVDSVILWRDDEVAFSGMVAKVSEGVGGFDHLRDGTRETFRWSGPDLWGVLHQAIAFPDPSLDPTVDNATPIALASASAATDIFTSSNHGLVAGQRVTFPTLTGGAGLTAGSTVYYVIETNLTSTTFQVSATLGGAAVNFTTNITAGTVLAIPVRWAVTHDTRTGVASSVLAGIIRDNIGDTAIVSARRYLGLVVTDAVVGVSNQFSVRCQYLDEVAARIATDGQFRCRLALAADLTVTVILDAPTDLSAAVVISDQGDLANVALRRVPRSADWVLTAGQGEGVDRKFQVAQTTPTSGRRIEVFNDQSSLATLTELLLSAQSALRSGAATWSIDAEVTDNLARTMRYGRDLKVGDRITIEVDGVRSAVPITSAVFTITPERQQVRPQLGAGVPDELVGLIKDVADLAARLERQIS